MSTIPLFANSGHHFYFVPLDNFAPEASRHANLEASDHEGKDGIETLCSNDELPWTVLEQQPWIRYRPGRSGEGPDQKLGFWIAIESNVGTPERGLVYDFEKKVVEGDVSPDSAKPNTPYAYSDVNRVRPRPVNTQNRGGSSS